MHQYESGHKRREPLSQLGGNGLSKAPVQAFFSTVDEPGHVISYTGEKLLMQVSDLVERPLKKGEEKKYHIIDNFKGEIHWRKAQFYISDDLSIAVVAVPDRFRPKTFFAKQEILTKAQAKMVDQKATVMIKKTGHMLYVDGHELQEAEIIPIQESVIEPLRQRQKVFPNMPLRAASSAPTKYMFGYSTDVVHETPLGIKLRPPYDHLGEVSSAGEGSGLRGIDGDFAGVRGLVKLMVTGESLDNPDEVRRKAMEVISKDERVKWDKQYRHIYNKRKKDFDYQSSMLGVNQFAKPDLGDSVVTFMRSDDHQDMGLFEQGNYHGAVVAVSSDGNDYICFGLRRRLDLEVQQIEKYYQKAGIKTKKFTPFDIRNNLGMMASTSRGEAAYLEYKTADKHNVPPHQCGFLRIYGGKRGQSYHEMQKGKYFNVPAPFTVVLSALEQGEELDGGDVLEAESQVVFDRPQEQASALLEVGHMMANIPESEKKELESLHAQIAAMERQHSQPGAMHSSLLDLDSCITDSVAEPRPKSPPLPSLESYSSEPKSLKDRLEDSLEVGFGHGRDSTSYSQPVSLEGPDFSSMSTDAGADSLTSTSRKASLTPSAISVKVTVDLEQPFDEKEETVGSLLSSSAEITEPSSTGMKFPDSASLEPPSFSMDSTKELVIKESGDLQPELLTGKDAPLLETASASIERDLSVLPSEMASVPFRGWAEILRKYELEFILDMPDLNALQDVLMDYDKLVSESLFNLSDEDLCPLARWFEAYRAQYSEKFESFVGVSDVIGTLTDRKKLFKESSGDFFTSFSEIFEDDLEHYKGYVADQFAANILHQRFMLILKMERIVNIWHHSSPMMVDEVSDETLKVAFPIMKFLNYIQNELEEIVHQMKERKFNFPVVDQASDSKVQKLWKSVREPESVSYGADVKESMRKRMLGMHARLIAVPRGRKLLEAVYEGDGKNTVEMRGPSNRKGRLPGIFSVSAVHPNRATPNIRNERNRSTGSNVLVELPFSHEMDDASYMAFGLIEKKVKVSEQTMEREDIQQARASANRFETKKCFVLSPAYVRYARGLAEVVNIKTGYWERNAEKSHFKAGGKWAEWGNFETMKAVENVENPLREELFLPRVMDPSLFSLYQKGGPFAHLVGIAYEDDYVDEDDVKYDVITYVLPKKQPSGDGTDPK
ncbi:hypothetical protein [Aureibacter tunicatorum]|uniref:Uncharacterized protein n=1 Tax=Aureibacter tunicatorum TaxID=866807 RepID=A0AAE3XRH8_9BACT|nr:hypothetical protein [Aureibacter tunicatorum]MDR6240689.1 hypothetical protein [Aureibacter tunicatorum]BDD06978.1 hypothetical protein AUTU_44610 [Aureibacter tunicatorum]